MTAPVKDTSATKIIAQNIPVVSKTAGGWDRYLEKGGKCKPEIKYSTCEIKEARETAKLQKLIVNYC